MNSTSIMLFGSVARGDNSIGSDVDYLVVSDNPKATIECDHLNASISKYTWDEFNELVDKRMLFIQHLKQEGSILSDQNNRLKNILNTFSPKKSYRNDYESTKSLLNLLSIIPEKKYSRAWYADVLFITFRNLMITKLAEKKEYVFSPQALASALGKSAWDSLKLIRKAKHAYRNNTSPFYPTCDLIENSIKLVTESLSIDFTPITRPDKYFIAHLLKITESNYPWYHKIRAAEGILNHNFEGSIPATIWNKHKDIITNQISYRFFSSSLSRDSAIFSIIEDAFTISTHKK